MALKKKDNNDELRAVFLEYKCKNSSREPIGQITDYKQTVINLDKHNYEHLENKFKKITKDKNNWSSKGNAIGNFWKRMLLICVVDTTTYYNFNNLKTNADKRKEENLILLEIKRYEDQENYFVYLDLLNKDNRDKWQGLLGMKSKSLIIQIPKEEWKEKKIGSKSKRGSQKPATIKTKKTLSHIPERAGESREKENVKPNLEQFLAENKADEQTKEMAREIDSHICSLDKSIIGEASQPVKNKFTFFAYHHKEKKSFLSFCLRIKEKKIKAYLKRIRETEITNNIWEINKEKGGYQKQFNWIVTVKDKADCKKLTNSVKDYLEAIK
ncbi:hypothetical protein [endosymbiont GvMRE of Glomus versiforme]|uniref:hypothetical protein n=1 Tax=endosymbiont GvMRE of Glomus versiforme TaxID=2039283 RepID=UPI0011C41473|nr:hypothetical protein [endosymbiont GvMRE of Glomus versiforme]